MRQIILDTETSGLDFEKDRIIEVGCLELINGNYTGIKFHQYFNPDGLVISQEAENIHGLNNAFLSKFKTFDNELNIFLSFIDNCQLIIHNAQFDLTMINQSLKRTGKKEINYNQTICTLELAKKKYPGSKNNLNALCRRFDISLVNREKHSALTDSFLLLEVYNELLGGKQQKLELNLQHSKAVTVKEKELDMRNLPRVKLNEDEQQSHKNMLNKLRRNLWAN